MRFLAEERPNDIPRRVWRDPFLVVVFMVGLAIELSLRDIPWRAGFLIVWTPLPLTLLWRRTHPLHAIAGFMVTLTIFDIALAIAGQPLPDVWSAAFALILVYAVFRWGSGREAMWACGILTVAVLTDLFAGFATVGDTIGGFIILALTAETGIVVRRQLGITEAKRQTAKSQEREQLARELHDTVAHHVSAIAIQAQAGRAVLDADPGAAAKSFEAIEESASRALAEMRVVVDALRGDAPLAPNRGLDDIEELANEPGPAVTIHRSGDLDELAPPVGSALYRLAQESITNARRHAPLATGIAVELSGSDERVRLRVVNDGAPVSFRGNGGGHGLTGMKERATLLGGTFAAGPRPGGGWANEAVLPKSGQQQNRLLGSGWNT